MSQNKEKTMTNRLITLLGVLCVTGVSTLHAQKTVSKANTITATATVEAVDYSARRVTLKTEKGETDTYVVDPAIKRFDSVKVGDKVRLTYYESLVFQLVKPGQKSSGASDEAALTRAKGAQPAGSIATQEKRTVTVKAVDPSVPSITVMTDDGRTVSRKVEDKKNIEGVKAGDKIDITYTQALLTSIETAK
jgi:Cu/Ag efflux protein CusF